MNEGLCGQSRGDTRRGAGVSPPTKLSGTCPGSDIAEGQSAEAQAEGDSLPASPGSALAFVSTWVRAAVPCYGVRNPGCQPQSPTPRCRLPQGCRKGWRSATPRGQRRPASRGVTAAPGSQPAWIQASPRAQDGGQAGQAVPLRPFKSCPWRGCPLPWPAF